MQAAEDIPEKLATSELYDLLCLSMQVSLRVLHKEHCLLTLQTSNPTKKSFLVLQACGSSEARVARSNVV